VRTCLISRCKPYRISLVLVLTALLSAWTCTAIIDFDNCRTPYRNHMLIDCGRTPFLQMQNRFCWS
jgi:hypothetical protein